MLQGNSFQGFFIYIEKERRLRWWNREGWTVKVTRWQETENLPTCSL
jgi:hypothetical protein